MLIAIIRSHLIMNKRHGMFRVWKGLRELDESDEEWVEANIPQVHHPMQVMDEGVDVGQMLHDLFVPLNEIDAFM